MNQIVKDKSFWGKPYACSDCLDSNRLKCKKCMAQIVNSILQQRKQQASPKRPSNLNINPSKSIHMGCSAKRIECSEVSNNFELWMKKNKNKRIPLLPDKFTKQQTSKVLKQITHQIAPKFETWQFRMVHRLSKSEPYLKLLRESKQPK